MYTRCMASDPCQEISCEFPGLSYSFIDHVIHESCFPVFCFPASFHAIRTGYPKVAANRHPKTPGTVGHCRRTLPAGLRPGGTCPPCICLPDRAGRRVGQSPGAIDAGHCLCTHTSAITGVARRSRSRASIAPPDAVPPIGGTMPCRPLPAPFSHAPPPGTVPCDRRAG